MAQRGRKSAASLAVITAATDTPLRAPVGLTEAEIDLWMETVRLVPASFFPPESSEQLAAYVRHSIAARDISRMISKFNPKWTAAEGGLERLDRLMKMRDREVRGMFAAARSLRLTNQSRQDPKSAFRDRANNWGSGSYYGTMDFNDD